MGVYLERMKYRCLPPIIRNLKISALAAIFTLGALAGPVLADSVTQTQEQISAKSKQIEALQQQIDQYQREIEQTHSKSKTLQNEISQLNAKISQVTLEIRSLAASIDRTSLEIRGTENQITVAEARLNAQKESLGQYLRLAYARDRTSLTKILLSHATLSDFFSDVNRLQTTQDTLRALIDEVKQLKEDLDARKDDLEEKKSDMEHLRDFQEIEKHSLDGNKAQKDKILKQTKGQESKFQELVQRSQQDIERLRDEIYYLQRNGVSVEDAIKYGNLAAIAAGIRPAFLLAILEIESGLGRNVGTGNWLDDMYNCYLRLGKPQRAEQEKSAFLEIIGKLGLDANSVKVSREPNYGCGGALGPAQFLPTTWLAYETQVAQLTGHVPPSPWTIEDAFTASAVKLARAGATSKDRAGENGAARAYIGGKPTCSSAACTYYANAVLRKAAEIERDL